MLTISSLNFDETVRTRHSVRCFLPTPISLDVIEDILAEAERAPSNCNTQPWSNHIVAGKTLERLSGRLLTAMRSSDFSLDFTFDKDEYPAPYGDRASQQGSSYHQALGVARGDTLSRAEVVERNVRFFGAPHAAFLFQPMVGDNVRVAADVGMYAQTFLLSLASRGDAGVPQAVLSYFADIVREVLGVPQEMKLLFGISFGRPDTAHASAAYREGRVPVAESVVWHD